MNSPGYPGDFTSPNGVGGTGTGGVPVPPVIGRNQTGQTSIVPFGFRRHHHHHHQQQHEDQIAQRRMDLLIGKRSFGDYLSYQHLNQLRQHPQQPQQQPLSNLQRTSLLLQNQNIMRSVKQRTTTTNNNNNDIIDLCNSPNNSSCNSVTRFGVPVYQPTRQQQQQIQTPFINNNINYPLNRPCANLNPGQTGWYNSTPVQPCPIVEKQDRKVLNTLQDLEKHLLQDDDDFGVGNDQGGDGVSGITNSEWSETFQNLMNPSPGPNPSSSPVSVNNNNSVVVSPSPTSSTSSCCSTSAPATGSLPTTVTLPAMQLIAEVATAISDGKNDVANELLLKLNQFSDSKGNSEQRLAYYMYHALNARANPNLNANTRPELYGSEKLSANYSLYDISPCFKFGLLAANLVMLEAITGAIQEGLNIHVLDFDIGHGAQYVNLLRALAERKTRLPCTNMRITVIETELGDQSKVPQSVKDGLVELAERVGIKLQCTGLARPIHELSRESLGIVEGEAVIVNFAFRVYRVPDESVSTENLRDELLRRVKGLTPRAVTLVEQDMNGNTAGFVTRVNEAREYYGALFDSLEATLPRDNPDRCRVEKGLGRKMANLVGFEGWDRVERAEVFGKWRARMGMAGFELKPLGRNVAESMRERLNSGRAGNPGFTVKEENGGVGFGWMGRNLTVASAWR